MYTRLFHLFSVITLVLAFASLLGCGANVVHPPPPPPPCDPALNCVFVHPVNAAASSNCVTPISDGPILLFQATNGHPKRDIWASFLTTEQHLNQNVQPTITATLAFVQHGGMPSDLGCQFTKNADGTYNQWQFVPENACFADDPSCTPSAVLPPHAPNAVCSLSRCTAPYCIHYAFNSVPPPGNAVEQQAGHGAAITAQQLISHAPPFTTDLSSLFGLATACSKTANLSVDQNWGFSGQGNSCEVQLPLTYDPSLNLNWVVLDFAPSVHGNLRAVPPSERDLIFDDPAQSIRLTWIDSNNQLLGTESVAKIMVTQRHLTIVGNKTYCIQIDMPNP